MNTPHIILREISHRRANFAMSVLAAAVALACVLIVLSSLTRFNYESARIIARKEREAEKQMSEMRDDFRKVTKKMGFNLLILPKNQDLGDFYDKNYATETMPESFAKRLGDSRQIATIRHLLPMLQVKTDWPEFRRRILLIGVRGEMPWAHRKNKKPILKKVRQGFAVLGYELHRSNNLKIGDTITFKGKKFTIQSLKPECGTIDDITIWIPLKDAQTMFDKKGRINCMLALECACAWADLPKIRAELGKLLPETKIVELSGKALARAETRWKADQHARELIERDKKARMRLKTERENMAALLIPFIALVCAVWIAMLALANVRERRGEIGLFRAIGMGAPAILKIFLLRAFLAGALGGLLGVAGVVMGFTNYYELSISEFFANYISLSDCFSAILAISILSLFAAWLPAILAAQMDPAEILREE